MKSLTEFNPNSLSCLTQVEIPMNKFLSLSDPNIISQLMQQNSDLRDDLNNVSLAQRKELYKPLIILGPSGVGKSTLITRLTNKYPNSFGFSVSYTTRAPRPGEVDGKSYFFITKEEFKQMQAQDAFIESFQVHDNFYGTAKAQIDSIRQSGKIPLLDIDIQGTKKFLACFPATNTLLILPPSLGEIEKRLRNRGTETEKTLATRVANSIREVEEGMKSGGLISCRMVNKDLLQAGDMFVKLIEGMYPAELTSNKKRFIFVLGGPASGKGTQCAKIVDEFGFTHISVGDLMREEIQKDTVQAQQIRKIISEGALVPPELTVEILINYLMGTSSSNYLIDGFPRAVDQAKLFESHGLTPDKILFYDVPQEVMIARCMKRAETSGRSDDNAETIKKRVQTYFNQTLPVVDYYKNSGKLVKMDAMGTVDQVYGQTSAALGGSGSNDRANFEAVLAKIKSHLVSQGPRTIRSMGSVFKSQQMEPSKFVSLLKDTYWLDLSDTEGKILAQGLTSSGQIDVNLFMVSLRDKMNSSRQAIVDECFNKYDSYGIGTVNASDLRPNYACYLHPRVQSGDITEDEAFVEFLSCFPDSSNNGTIEKFQWDDYYDAVSSVVSEDDYFITMMAQAWNL